MTCSGDLGGSDPLISDMSLLLSPVPASNDGSPSRLLLPTRRLSKIWRERDVLSSLVRSLQKLGPSISYKVRELYKGSNIVITQNGYHCQRHTRRCPQSRSRTSLTTKCRKAGSTGSIDCSGNRDEGDFVKFITENAVNKFRCQGREDRDSS